MDKASTTTAAGTIIFQRFPAPVAAFAGFAEGDDPPDCDSASRANAKSDADWKRCSGFFSRQRWTTRCSAGGIFAVTCEIPGGSSFRIAVIVSGEVGF